MQRAVAHAHLHRNQSLPTLRSSLGYMTSTARVAGEAEAIGHAGQSTVTAFLHPHAQLAEVWSLGRGDTGIPRHLAIARVTYTGIPSGVGLRKDTMVLLTSAAYGVDDAISLV